MHIRRYPYNVVSELVAMIIENKIIGTIYDLKKRMAITELNRIFKYCEKK